MVSKHLDEYIRHAADHGRFTMDGNAKATNKAYDRLQQVFIAIIKDGDGNSLFDLYEHPDPWVQAWAAAHSLEIDQTRALKKLEKLEKASNPHVSTDAEYTIKEWNSGELRFLK